MNLNYLIVLPFCCIVPLIFPISPGLVLTIFYLAYLSKEHLSQTKYSRGQTSSVNMIIQWR
jgi:hypothetical protein